MKHAAHLVAALALVLLAARTSTASPPTATAVVFEAVDAVTVIGDSSIRIEGLVQGESAPRTMDFHMNTHYPAGPAAGMANCHRQAMMALSKPGRFFLEFDHQYYDYNCTLRRR